jgi:predicted ABC-type transport system involved in lysophospholipase L1 biosynthesis ATPase subunit
MALLEVADLSKRYPDGSRELVVLDGVSFEVDENDFVGLWGLRRSGKSTLLRVVAGLEPPDAGSVRLDGVELIGLGQDARVRLLRKSVALAAFGLWTHRNRLVHEHVAVAASADARVTGKGARVMARRALNRLDVLDCAERRLDQLSFEEQIRVELARAIVRSPRLLLIDDPPALQSPREDSQLRELVTSLGDEIGCAVLVTSSDVGVVQRARRMMALGRGRLRTMDEPGVVVRFPDRTGTDDL